MRLTGLITMLCVCSILGGCVTPSVGVGVGIPGTPIGIGVGVPLWKDAGGDTPRVYRTLIVESLPAGAELLINDALVGSTPATVQVPFAKGYWGAAKGEARLLLRKPGYLPEGVQLFPASGGRLATRPGGAPVDKLEVTLRPSR